MTKLQFRVLYREFLFRMVDLELLSADALGDSSKLLGQPRMWGWRARETTRNNADESGFKNKRSLSA